MYLWMILATFMAILASFGLSYRADMREITISPKAETVVARIVQKQKAAIKYVYDNSPPEKGMLRPAYVQGRIDDDDLTGYLPYGFNDDGKFISYIYCIDSRSENTGFDTPSAGCGEDYTISYLITYGCVPERWRLLSTGGPNMDLLTVMRKYMDYGNNFGYAEISDNPPADDLNTTMRIVGKEGTGTQIPQYIIDANLGEDSFKVVCATKKEWDPDVEEESCPYCLVYMRPFK